MSDKLYICESANECGTDICEHDKPHTINSWCDRHCPRADRLNISYKCVPCNMEWDGDDNDL